MAHAPAPAPAVPAVPTILFHNERGGVGKSSAVRTVGFSLAHVGNKVLLVDLDQQRSLSKALMSRAIGQADYKDFIQRPPGLAPFPTVRSTIKQMLCPGHDEHGAAIPRRVDAVDYVPEISTNTTPALPGGWIRLILGDADNWVMDEMLSLSDWNLSRDANTFGEQPSYIFRVIQATARQQGADFVLIDLQPTVSMLARYVIFSSHYLVVCARAEADSIGGMSSMCSKISGNEHFVDEQGNPLQDLPQAVMQEEGGWLLRFQQTVWPNSPSMPRVVPKYLGYIVCMMDGHVCKGGLQYSGGLCTHKFAGNAEGQLQALGSEFARLRKRCHHRGLAFAPSVGDQHDVYSQLGITPCLGIIPPYTELEHTAVHRNTVVPFLQREAGDFLRIKHGEWVESAHVQRTSERIMQMRHLWAQACWNILQLIFRDGGNGSQLPAIMTQGRPPACPNLGGLAKVAPDGSPFRARFNRDTLIAHIPLPDGGQRHPWSRNGAYAKAKAKAKGKAKAKAAPY